MEKGGFTYIITNKNQTTFYVGVTSNLKRRLFEHKNKINPNSFSARYNLSKLIYFEYWPSIDEAIMREKKLKNYSRKRKIEIIQRKNPNWEDLENQLDE
jgi:putative endonuclease